MPKGKKVNKDAAEVLKAKQAKFVELANKRVPKTLKAIKLIGNLGAAAYSCTPAQKDAIIKAFRAAVDQVEQRLTPGAKSAEPEFKLPG